MWHIQGKIFWSIFGKARIVSALGSSIGTAFRLSLIVFVAGVWNLRALSA